MEHQEFSSPQAEFSPPRQEFASTGREFSAVGQEHLPHGTEFYQTAAQPERKKRRARALMLTTAAVVAGAVTLPRVPVPQPERWEIPSLTLRQEDCQYLDALTAAVKNRDFPQMATLVNSGYALELLRDELYPRILADEEFNSYTRYDERISSANENHLYYDFPLFYTGEKLYAFCPLGTELADPTQTLRINLDAVTDTTNGAEAIDLFEFSINDNFSTNQPHLSFSVDRIETGNPIWRFSEQRFLNEGDTVTDLYAKGYRANFLFSGNLFDTQDFSSDYVWQIEGDFPSVNPVINEVDGETVVSATDFYMKSGYFALHRWSDGVVGEEVGRIEVENYRILSSPQLQKQKVGWVADTGVSLYQLALEADGYQFLFAYPDQSNADPYDAYNYSELNGRYLLHNHW